jgi:N6-L-threonylcarbamoyladenine synthase
MIFLSIETSCDETAIALVEARGGLVTPQFKILKNLVASQIKIHAPFGGIVPNLAKREHLRNLPILFDKLKTKNQKLKVDIVAVTVGPGLEPCLWTGINFARRVGRELTTKLIGASHLEGHLYSFLLSQKANPGLFPAIALIVSGGHTILLLMDDLVHYKKLGETRDDAVGECFDKAARLLKLPYPGGPEIEKIAKDGNSTFIDFPRPMLSQKNYDFSFSGLKTSVLYYLRDNKDVKIEDVAASFQAAAFDVLISKTLRAAKEYKAKSVLISGGVASNLSLIKDFKLRIKKEKLKINFFVPPKKFCTDNAAMIAVAGYINYLGNVSRRLTARGSLVI